MQKYITCIEYDNFLAIISINESTNNNINIISDLTKVKGDDKVLTFPIDDFIESKIKYHLKHLQQNQVVGIIKPIPERIMIYDIYVFDINGIDKEDSFKKLKELYTIKTIGLFDSHINTVSNLTYYEFTVLNNELANYGIFITNENREEKYIEILEREDEDLINILEKYLMCKDEIERVSAGYYNYREFVQKLNESTTEEELTEAYDAFFKEWVAKANYLKN